LLPDWYDDWVVAEAEEWRQLRMNALEAQARILTQRGRLPEAAVAARAAIKVEPLRESGYAALIRVYLAEGNQSEALRVFDRYRELLDSVLGLTPTSLLSDLVATIRG
jgi:DNA-binding SARP family transcriptional activator